MRLLTRSAHGKRQQFSLGGMTQLSVPASLGPTWLPSIPEHPAGNQPASQGCQLDCLYATLSCISRSEQGPRSYTLGGIWRLLFPWPGKSSLLSILEFHKPWPRMWEAVATRPPEHSPRPQSGPRKPRKQWQVPEIQSPLP